MGWDPCPVQQAEKACHQYPYHRSSPRGPSYWRRQDRRRQAAQTAAAAASADTVTVTDKIHSDYETDIKIVNAGKAVDEKSSEENKNNKTATEKVSESNESEEEIIETTNEALAEKAEKCHSCDLCDFATNWVKGLRVHITRMHKNIEQLDGCEDLVEDEKYLSCSRYWKDGYLGTSFQAYLDALDILETSNLSEEDKILEKDKVLEARKEAFGSEFKYYPPWRTREQSCLSSFSRGPPVSRPLYLLL